MSIYLMENVISYVLCAEEGYWYPGKYSEGVYHLGWSQAVSYVTKPNVAGFHLGLPSFVSPFVSIILLPFFRGIFGGRWGKMVSWVDEKENRGGGSDIAQTYIQFLGNINIFIANYETGTSLSKWSLWMNKKKQFGFRFSVFFVYVLWSSYQ